MPTFSTSQLLRYMAFGAIFLFGGIVTVVVAAIGMGQGRGVPEFMLFAVRLGWMIVVSALVWEAVAFIKLLLKLSESPVSSRRHE